MEITLNTIHIFKSLYYNISDVINWYQRAHKKYITLKSWGTLFSFYFFTELLYGATLLGYYEI